VDLLAFHKFLLWMTPVGIISVLAGWVLAETGRQPRVVYGYLRTSAAVSHLAPAAILFSVVVFIVTALVQWPAAVILLAGSLIVPPNMRLAGLFASEGMHEQVAASTRLTAVVLDSFRGMRTLP
jgi:bd-type cytochrome oxidase subunit I